MMILVFGAMPLLISYMITSRFDSKAVVLKQNIDTTL